MSLLYQLKTISCKPDDVKLADIINSANKDILVNFNISVYGILTRIEHCDEYDFFILFDFKIQDKSKNVCFIDSYLNNLLTLTLIDGHQIIKLLQIIRVDSSQTHNYKKNKYLGRLETNNWVKITDEKVYYFFKFLELKTSDRNVRLLPYQETDFITKNTTYRNSDMGFGIYMYYLLSVDFTKSFPLIENDQEFQIKNIIFPVTLNNRIKEAYLENIGIIDDINASITHDQIISMTVIFEGLEGEKLSFKKCESKLFVYSSEIFKLVSGSSIISKKHYLNTLKAGLAEFPEHLTKLVDITNEELAKNTRKVISLNGNNIQDNSEMQNTKKLENKIIVLENKIKDMENMPSNIEVEKYKNYLYVCIVLSGIILVSCLGFIVFKVVNRSNDAERRRVRRLRHGSRSPYIR